MNAHPDLPPSPWIRRWIGFVRPGGAVLDVACGSGRHARWLAELGFEVDWSQRHTFDGYQRLHTFDSHGNRVELLSPT